MSIDHVSKVLNLGPEVNGTTRMVLFVLAEAANQDSDECWPGTATIRRRAGLKQDRYVTKAVAALVELGLISVDPNGCPDHRIRADRRPNLYRMTGAVAILDGGAQRAGSSAGRGGASRTDGGARRARTGGRVAPSAPHIEPELEPEEVTLAADAAGGAEEPTEAHVITQGLWKWCEDNGKPRPTLRANGATGRDRTFVALRGIVQQLLDAGHKAPAIKRALTSTKAWTLDAITFELRREEQTRPSGARAVTTDRTRPSGVVRL